MTTGTKFETENGYVLCAQHLNAWRSGGNDVAAREMSAQDLREYTREFDCVPSCADCAEFVGAYSDGSVVI